MRAKRVAELQARPKILVNVLEEEGLRMALAATRLPAHSVEAIVKLRPFGCIDDLKSEVSRALTALAHSPMGGQMARELSLQMDFRLPNVFPTE